MWGQMFPLQVMEMLQRGREPVNQRETKAEEKGYKTPFRGEIKYQ